MRALRVDKMTYAAIEATLRLYERGVAVSEVPVIRAIAMSRVEIEGRATRFSSSVAETTSGHVRASCEDGESVIGGGSAPEVKLPTVLVALEHSELSASSMEERLRRRSVPIIARTERDRVLIDLRTVAADEEAIILDALANLGKPATPNAASADM
jgi:L-seryl-tRNA(Ser) seleniumtransferase